MCVALCVFVYLFPYRQEGRRQASMYRPVMSRTQTVDVSPLLRRHADSHTSADRRVRSTERHRHPEFTHSVQLPATSAL